jgi:hypothetical protein
MNECEADDYGSGKRAVVAASMTAGRADGLESVPQPSLGAESICPSIRAGY